MTKDVSRSRKNSIALIVATLALALLAGGGRDQGAAADESEIRIGVMTYPQSLGDPLFGTQYPETLGLNAVYDSLIYLDDAGRPQSHIAESWSMATDREWIFKLKENLTFSNDEPLNANAVVSAIDFLVSEEGRALQLGNVLRMIESARVIDDLTLAVTTPSPTPTLPLHMRLVRIPAPNALQESGRVEFARHPVGSGPFALEDWTDSKIELKANPTSPQRPNVDGIIVQRIPDATARLQGLISGAIDIAIGLDPDNETTVDASGARFLPRLEPTVNYIALVTTEDKNLVDRRVRQAMNYAVNKQRIIDAFLAGATRPASQFAHGASFGYNESLTPYPYDPGRATTLLKEAGFETGFPLTLLIVPGVGINASALHQVIAADLAAIGIATEVRGIPQSQKVRHMYQGGWPGSGYAVTFTGYDPLETFRSYGCVRANPIHCDPDLEEAVDQALMVTNIEARRLATSQILEMQRENPPGILLWQGVAFDGVAQGVGGYDLLTDTLIVENLSRSSVTQ